MKLQLNEQEINAYINEAITQELYEAKGGFLGKLGNRLLRRGSSKATSAVPRVVGKAPRTRRAFTFLQNIRDAKGARLAIKDFESGKVLKSTVKSGKGHPGKDFYIKKGPKGKAEFFYDPACQQKVTFTRGQYKGSFAEACQSSWSSSQSHMRNLLRSAQLNMGGTAAAAAALGTGAALLAGGGSGRDGNEGNGGNDPDAPWNGGGGDPQEPTAPNNGGFPWDNTEPRWTPRAPRRTAPQPAQQPAQPTQPEEPQRQPMEPVQAVTPPVSMPTGVTGPQQGIQMREPQSSLLGSASQAMVNAASTSPAVASQREQNRAINQTYRNARDAMKRDDYGPTAKQDMQTLKNVKKAIKRGDQHPSLEEGKLNLSEAQLNAYLNEAINEELDEIFGLSRSEQNAKWGYNWDKNLSAKQNRRNRAINKAQIKAAGYRNAQEYEAGEGHAYGTQQQEPVYQPGEQSQTVNFEAGYPAPFANEKYKVGQFQTWFNQNMGGELVVDGIWGKYTQAAWDQWLNSQGQGQEPPAMSN